MAPSPTPPVALSVAGSDPSGGAGIQADLKTFSALEVYGAAALTALTAQDARGVRAVHDLPAGFVAAQVDCVLEDLEVRAVKLGMLSRAEVIEAVAGRLEAHRARNVVLDPVLVAKSGDALLAPEALATLKARLLPLADVLTPNLPEAAALLSMREGEVLCDLEGTCRRLLELGPRAVLLKGGHAGGAYSEDLYSDGGELLRLGARRIDTPNTHGTGCTLSAALAAWLARGATPREAARAAKRYVTEAIEGARRWTIGHGHGPVHHFHAQWPSEE